MARAAPGWMWKSPITEIALEKARGVENLSDGERAEVRIRYGLLGVFFVNLGRKGTGKIAKGGPKGQWITRPLACLLTAVVISVILLQLLLQSADRGQILFALGVSFLVGVLVAYQVFPVRPSLVATAAPLLAAVVFYAMAAFVPIPPTPEGWIKVPLYARALPVDWLTAGCGGAVLGYWISWRIHELRLLEKEEEE